MIVNTKFMPQTDKKGGRLKAVDDEGRWPAVVIPYDYDLTPYGNHIKVMKEYIKKHDLVFANYRKEVIARLREESGLADAEAMFVAAERAHVGYHLHSIAK